MSKKAVIVGVVLLAACGVVFAMRRTDENGDGGSAAPAPEPLPFDPGAADWIDQFNFWTTQNQQEIEANTMPTPQPAPAAPVDSIASVKAYGAGWTEVVYADGRIERRTGVRSWRNNNPGNIEYGNFARANGAVGTDGRFAVFPTYAAGRAAKAALIFEAGSYRNLSLSSAIARYAPPSENNTSWYAATVLAAAGADKRMGDYQPEERERILDAMERVEGFKVGAVAQTGTTA